MVEVSIDQSEVPSELVEIAIKAFERSGLTPKESDLSWSIDRDDRRPGQIFYQAEFGGKCAGDWIEANG